MAGIDAELLDEEIAGGVERAERIRLATTPIEGEDKLRLQSLVEVLLRDQSLQLGHDLLVLAEQEASVDLQRKRRRAQLAEPFDVTDDEGLVGDILERRPSPQHQRLGDIAEHALSVCERRSRGEAFGRLRHPPLEEGHVDLLLGDVEQIATVDRPKLDLGQRAAQVRHVDLQRGSAAFAGSSSSRQRRSMRTWAGTVRPGRRSSEIRIVRGRPLRTGTTTSWLRTSSGPRRPNCIA